MSLLRCVFGIRLQVRECVGDSVRSQFSFFCTTTSLDLSAEEWLPELDSNQQPFG